MLPRTFRRVNKHVLLLGQFDQLGLMPNSQFIIPSSLAFTYLSFVAFCLLSIAWRPVVQTKQFFYLRGQQWSDSNRQQLTAHQVASGFVWRRIQFVGCAARYHSGCIHVGPSFRTRLTSGAKGHQYPPTMTPCEFSCEARTVRLHLGRELQNSGLDSVLLMLSVWGWSMQLIRAHQKYQSAAEQCFYSDLSLFHSVNTVNPVKKLHKVTNGMQFWRDTRCLFSGRSIKSEQNYRGGKPMKHHGGEVGGGK